MAQNLPQKPRDQSDLTKNLRAYLLNRDKKPESQTQGPKKHLEVQVLLGELENLLKSMDQADARIQRTLSKLHELKTAILLALGND